MQYYSELVNSLKRGVLAPVYLFYGEETYLREQAVQRFKDYFAGEESDQNCEIVDGETISLAEVVSRAETRSFFGGKRLMVVKRPLFLKVKPTAAAAKKPATDGAKEQVLLNYLENPLPSTCLIFTTDEVLDKRRKIFRYIKKSGQAIEFTYLKKGDLLRWLNKMAAEAGKKFQPEAADALLNSAGPALQNLMMELDKLFSFTVGQDTIELADVHRVVVPAVEDNIFAIVDAIGHKRCGEALNGIKDLLAAKEPPFRLLAMIARQFRLLLQVSDLIARGDDPKDIISILKIPPFVYRKVADQSLNFNKQLLTEALTVLSDIEADIKTGRQEFYPAIEIYLLKLSIENN